MSLLRRPSVPESRFYFGHAPESKRRDPEHPGSIEPLGAQELAAAPLGPVSLLNAAPSPFTYRSQVNTDDDRQGRSTLQCDECAGARTVVAFVPSQRPGSACPPSRSGHQRKSAFSRSSVSTELCMGHGQAVHALPVSKTLGVVACSPDGSRADRQPLP